jgi:succinate-semialdehyde dehydrogenase/glutarate-semialdehyde dehydrogenase
MYINGAWRDGANGKTLAIENPATGETVAHAAYGEVSDALDAMDAAATAFPAWKAATAYARGAHMDKAAALIRARADEIGRALTLENGKTLAEAVGETIGCAMWFEWFAEEGKRVYGRMIPSHFGHKRHWVIHQPVGVVVAVNPWNFPINLMSRKLAGALAAGCTIVSRPASQTPLSSMLLFECLHEAGFPPGVVNLVTGSAGKVTTAMLEHPACRKLTFTGSTETGKGLMQQAGQRITKLSLELGGHAPLLVFDDVKLDEAVEQTVVAKFRNAGQSCIAPTRIYVQRGIFDAFAEKVTARQAADWGMIWEAVPDEVFAAHVAARAGALAAGPTVAYRLVKEALRASPANGLEAQLALEARLQSEAGATVDFREGVAAFLEKRPARFRGA